MAINDGEDDITFSDAIKLWLKPYESLFQINSEGIMNISVKSIISMNNLVIIPVKKTLNLIQISYSKQYVEAS